MTKYEYREVNGFKDKKFIENGHTMFESDVLQRLKRLEYLESKLKKEKIQSAKPTEWIYITKNLRCRFEFWSCLSGIKIMVVFEKNTHWSLNGFHFTKKWRFWKTDFNTEIQKYSKDFCG